MNNVILVGRLTKNPEVKTFDKLKVSTITLAIDRPFKNQNGDIETDFIDVSFFDTKASALEEYCVKGSLIAVRGRLQQRINEVKNGDKTVNVHMFSVIGEQLTFLATPKDKLNLE